MNSGTQSVTTHKEVIGLKWSQGFVPDGFSHTLPRTVGNDPFCISLCLDDTDGQVADMSSLTVSRAPYVSPAMMVSGPTKGSGQLDGLSRTGQESIGGHRDRIRARQCPP